jgi:hypothetical protein
MSVLPTGVFTAIIIIVVLLSLLQEQMPVGRGLAR